MFIAPKRAPSGNHSVRRRILSHDFKDWRKFFFGGEGVWSAVFGTRSVINRCRKLARSRKAGIVQQLSLQKNKAAAQLRTIWQAEQQYPASAMAKTQIASALPLSRSIVAATRCPRQALMSQHSFSCRN